MKIVKLPWLAHQEETRKFEIYSINVAPDGSRLASGGLDGKIKVWSVEQITNLKEKYNLPAANNDQQQQQLDKFYPLASMARHTGAVTVVRFSPSGRFLASGSDDKVILIWEKSDDSENQNQRSQFGEAETDTEHWVVRKRLIGHSNDIEDIAWAPDSSFLISVGLDRSIIVWNGFNFEKLRRFDIHQSHVKGVAFDPANKYFATASDDRSVIIFRYHKSTTNDQLQNMNFSIETKIKAPFKGSPLTSYFRRLSWSPDGEHIAVPNATNGPLTTVAIIERGNWNSDISLIGHDLPCEVTSFSPILFNVRSSKKSKKKNEQKLSTIIATAGQDKSLAIWNSERSKPLIVATDISFKTITDLAWTLDGQTLFVSSLDGTITALFFEKNELGIPASLETINKHLHRFGVGRDSMIFPESVDQLILEDQYNKTFKKSLNHNKLLDESHMNKLMNKNTLIPNNIGLNTTANNSNNVKNFNPIISSSKNVNILIPRSKKNNKKIMPTLKKVNHLAPKKIIDQKIIITKDGKKRVSPTLISTSSSLSKSFSSVIATNIKIQKQLENLSYPNSKLPRFGVQTYVSGLREKNDNSGEGFDKEDDDDNEEILSTTTQKKSNILFDHKSSGITKFKEVEVNDKTITTNLKVYLSKTDVNNYRPKSVLQVIHPNQNKPVLPRIFNSKKVDVFEDNSDIPTKILINSFNCSDNCEFFIEDRVIQAVSVESKELWIIATSTNSLHFISFTGRLIYPKIQLRNNEDRSISFMNCFKDKYLVIILNIGIIHVWNIHSFQSLYDGGISLAPVLNTPISKFLSNSDIRNNNDGKPYVALENGEVYMWSTDMEVWLRIIDPWYLKSL
ncbi:Hir1p, partial [Ascoidea rubescens DSM 1968]